MAVRAALESLVRRNIAAQEQEAIRLLSSVIVQLANLIEEWSFAIKAEADAAGPAIARQRYYL
jgi:hypothetical protein